MAEQLGIIRIVPIFDGEDKRCFAFPYFDEQMFTNVVNNVKSGGYFQSDNLFIPLHRIHVIEKIPNEMLILETGTRQ